MIQEINGDFLQWLRGFYYVATAGSVSRAAELMCRNQSAVTYQLQSLESSLNTELFLRVEGRMILTPAGEKLLKWAVITFDDIAALRAEVGNLNGELNGALRISGNRPTYHHARFVNTLRAYSAAHPKVDIHLEAGYPDECIRDVEIGSSDMALIGLHKTPPVCAFEQLFSVPYVLVTPPGHEYHLDDRPTSEQIAEIPLIRFQLRRHIKSYDYHFLAEQIEELTGRVSPLSCSNYWILLKYVAEGMGAAIIDAWSYGSLSSRLEPGVWAYSLSHLLPVLPYGILTRKKGRLSPAATAFREALRNGFADTSPEGILPSRS